MGANYLNTYILIYARKAEVYYNIKAEFSGAFYVYWTQSIYEQSEQLISLANISRWKLAITGSRLFCHFKMLFRSCSTYTICIIKMSNGYIQVYNCHAKPHYGSSLLNKYSVWTTHELWKPHVFLIISSNKKISFTIFLSFGGITFRIIYGICYRIVCFTVCCRFIFVFIRRSCSSFVFHL